MTTHRSTGCILAALLAVGARSADAIDRYVSRKGGDAASGSPLIDAGSCTGAPALDIDGDPRPTGASCDIGADEFVP